MKTPENVQKFAEMLSMDRMVKMNLAKTHTTQDLFLNLCDEIFEFDEAKKVFCENPSATNKLKMYSEALDVLGFYAKDLLPDGVYVLLCNARYRGIESLKGTLRKERVLVLLSLAAQMVLDMGDVFAQEVFFYYNFKNTEKGRTKISMDNFLGSVDDLLSIMKGDRPIGFSSFEQKGGNS
jgi:hypothetical protein